jgi:protein-tyrosine-phosphatase
MSLPAEAQTPAVLFICTANISRSPMAVGLFHLILLENGVNPRFWRIESAGTWAPKGRPASAEAIATLAARGLHIEAHRSRVVSEKVLSGFPLVLTMEPGQKEALLVEFRWLKGKVFTLAEIAGEGGTIEDPTGGPIEAFAQTAAEIERLLRQGLPQIMLRAKG